MTNKIRQTALAMLARRDHSKHTLAKKLKMKGHDTNDIEPLLERFEETGLLNDSRYAENYIRYRQNKGYGPVRIKQELTALGLEDEVIAEHLRITDNAWLTNARNIWQKHFKGKLPTDYKDRAKQMRFLQYRGFTQEHIRSLFSTEEE